MKTKTAKEQDQKGKVIELPRPNIKMLQVTIEGDEGSSLVLHGWDAKVVADIDKKQKGEPVNKKAPKDPVREYHGTLYPLDEHGRYTADVRDPQKHKTGFGIKAMAIKKCMVEAAFQMLAQKKTWARCGFHVMGDYVLINGTPQMRRDMVRLPHGTIDIRTRADYAKWTCTIRIRYDDNVIHDGQILNMLANGGFGIGIGDWRIEKNGTHGMFHVAE